MPARIEMFSEARIRLSREVARHDKLCEVLRPLEGEDFEIKLAAIAAYCGVVVDGAYTQREIDALCDKLLDRLYKKRTGLLVLVGKTLH